MSKSKTKISKKSKLLIGGILVATLVGAGVAFLLTGGKPTVENVKKKIHAKSEEGTVTVVDLNSKSRPYAVMINNLNEARTVQSGLNNAYMVYEIIVEGGITRYLALFRDLEDDIPIGSVRSARHYYLDYVLENDAMYAHFGWSPQAQKDIGTLHIDNLNGLTYDGSYYYRINKIAAPHNAFIDSDGLRGIAEKRGYELETDKGLLLDYSAKSIDLTKYNPEVANKVDIVYSNYLEDVYEYDEKNKNYVRYVNGDAQIDHNDETPVTVKNIIIYQIENYTIAGDEKGRQFLNNIGTGEGYFVTEGKVVPITWEKKDRASKTVYKYSDGTKIKVNDGNTWIQIVPLNGSIEME